MTEKRIVSPPNVVALKDSDGRVLSFASYGRERGIVVTLRGNYLLGEEDVKAVRDMFDEWLKIAQIHDREGEKS